MWCRGSGWWFRGPRVTWNAVRSNSPSVIHGSRWLTSLITAPPASPRSLRRLHPGRMGCICTTLGKCCITVGTCGATAPIAAPAPSVDVEAHRALSASTLPARARSPPKHAPRASARSPPLSPGGKARARKSFGDKTVRAVHAKTDGRCLYCDSDLGVALNRIGRWNIEHSKPWSEAGSDDLCNLFATCYACNSYRSNRPVADLFRHPKFVQMHPESQGRRCERQPAGSATVCQTRFRDVAHAHCPAHRKARAGPAGRKAGVGALVVTV